MLLALMSPIFGVVFGHFLLGDVINGQFAIGSLLVICGIGLVNGDESIRPLKRWLGGQRGPRRGKVPSEP
jgi:drug/metabolite transporter (DMT)-like permease